MSNTTDADPEVSGVSKDQENYGKSKNIHFQVDHPPKVEQNQKLLGTTHFLKKCRRFADGRGSWDPKS
jgi:hypothetical protein